jgi:hypothetical protein
VFVEGSQHANITWISDWHETVYFWIFQNLTLILQGETEGPLITISLSHLSPGYYEYLIWVQTDPHLSASSVAMDSVQVHVLEDLFRFQIKPEALVFSFGILLIVLIALLKQKES